MDNEDYLATDGLARSRQQAQHFREIQQILRRQPTVPQKPFTTDVLPLRRFRGVSWLPGKHQQWTCDIYINTFGSPTETKLWMQALPCLMLRKRSEYFKGVLKQQGHLKKARVVLSLSDCDSVVELIALRRIFRFMLRAPLDLNTTMVSKDLIWLDGLAPEVLAEMSTWAKLLELRDADEAMADLEQRILEDNPNDREVANGED